MTYKHFYFAIILRLAILVLLASGSAYLLAEKEYLWCIVLGIFLMISIFNIIHYFNNINRWISFFLLGIENEDSTLKTPPETGNKAIDDIYKGINRLNNIFKQTKIDISTQEHYFRSVINQSATGLFSINDKGRIININPAAIKLTGLNNYHHVNILKNIDDSLPGFLLEKNENINQQSAIFENKYGQKLLFKLSEIKKNKERIILVAVSDITKELDTGEVEAWIKLARTLSHEIMNNIAPVTTLSKVISGYFVKNEQVIDVDDVNSKIIENTVVGLKVIEEQSVGLMSFVENYRKFTKLPEPQYTRVNLNMLLEKGLIAAEAFSGFNTLIIKKITEKIVFVNTDKKLLSQVIINLLKNAAEAITTTNTKNPKLTIKLKQTDESTTVEISNNGPQIPAEIREQIFVPFYTTKENGSGVGLSLSKQIMLKMGGDVLLLSETNERVTFRVVIY